MRKILEPKFNRPANENKDVSPLKILIVIISVLGTLLFTIKMTRLAKPLNCEEVKKTREVDPRFPNWTPHPGYFDPCDSINNNDKSKHTKSK
ncbi:hypothetical protein D3C71_993960 [compost metagenome]